MAAIDDRSLAGIKILAGLPPELRHRLEGLCQWRRFGRGEEIVGHQDPSREVFLITRGRVRVRIHTGHGREIAFEDLSAGEHFGELAAIDGKSRSASVVALEPTTLACLSGALFLDLCQRHPEISLAAMRTMTEIMRRFIDRVVELSTLGAQNRVHAELVRLARAGANEGRCVIQPVPRHAEIAARVSTTRETVARVLADLAHQDLVERQGNRLIIHDLEQLAAMVEDVQRG